MLWFPVGAIDFSLARNERRPTGLPVLNRISRCWFLVILLLSVVVGVSILAPYASAQSKGLKGKPPAKATPKDICGENSKRERRAESTRNTSALNSSKFTLTRRRISRI